MSLNARELEFLFQESILEVGTFFKRSLASIQKFMKNILRNLSHLNCIDNLIIFRMASRIIVNEIFIATNM